MGQFKPMVKMETTEPSVELKLKKGGKVHRKEKKMQMGGPSAGGDMTMSPPPGAQPLGGLTPPPGGMPMPMPGRRPKKPNMFARRRAMNRMSGMGDGGASDADMMMEALQSAQGAGQGAVSDFERAQFAGSRAPGMKKGGKADMKALKEHASKPASKAHKGLKTGGVVMGQGGYKAGGIIKTTAKKTTKMDTAHPDHDKGPTGGVKLGNAGGYKDGGMAKKYATGGVVMGQGGYKKGGKVKKFADGGGAFAGLDTVQSGAKQIGNSLGQIQGGLGSASSGGSTSPSYPSSPGGDIPFMPGGTSSPLMKQLGGYKKGGAAKKYAKGGSVEDSGRAQKMPQGRKPAPKPVAISELAGTYKKGGPVMTPAEKRLDNIFKKENAPAMKAAKKMSNEKYGKKMADGGMPEAVTETERSVTVVPGKKHGGRMAKGGSC
jgi:hypothetical protein